MISWKQIILLSANTISFLLVGSFLLLNPVGFFELNKVTLSLDPNLLSEIRAPGGALFLFGLFSAYSLFNEKFRIVGLALGGMVMIGYGLSRGLSIYMDGLPSDSLLMVFIFELSTGILSLSEAKKMLTFQYGENKS